MGLHEEAMERAAQGRHTVWLGSWAGASAPGWDVLIIHCDGPTTTFGPLGRAREEIEARTGARRDAQTSQALGRLRRRLLEQLPVATQKQRLLQALEAWDQSTGGRALLVFDALEAADDATLEGLRDLADASPVPWVLSWRRRPEPETSGDALFDALGPALGAAPEDTGEPGFDWSMLPPDVVHMMRLASVIGAVFEAELVGQMLGMDVDEVLYGIQLAYDLGARIEDRGEGTFALTADDVATLRGGLLPSLHARWSARLASMLIEEAPAIPAPSAPTLRSHDTEAAFARAAEGPSAVYAQMFEPEPADAPEPAPEPPSATPAEASAPFEPRPMPEYDEGDHARAAQYLEEAGQLEDAVSRLLVAARQVSARGDARRGWLMCRRALGLTLQMAPGARQRALRVRGLMELGRIQWRGAAMGPPFTLGDALSTLEEASRGLPPGADPAMRGELATWIAGVCYDLGDLASLQRGSQELARASRALLDHGAPVEAARLLNDQAAVQVRLGDPVQAVYLLHQSRRAFESIRRQDPEDPIAAFELGETQHLLATMPMHARVKPGQESEAVARGLVHAEAALALFEEVGQTREQARVLETMGRLELEGGDVDRAEAHLRAGLALQQQLGDVTGLARTTDALAQVYLARGDAAHALAVLAESIALHREKGSPAGLDVNHQTLDAITAALADRPGDENLEHALAAIHAHLAQAEGRAPREEA